MRTKARRDRAQDDRAEPCTGERQPSAAISLDDIADGNEAYHYWDGGLVDNTPLGAAIEIRLRTRRRQLLVVMNLFPLKAKLPSTLTEVSERVDQLRFGNRLRQDAERGSSPN